MKTVLVTGANKGIGFEIARQLGAAGCSVILSARNPERGQAAVAALQAKGYAVTWLEMDLGSPESIAAAAEQLTNKGTALDVLINNAGILLKNDQQILEAPADLIWQVLQANAVGALQVVQSFHPLLKRGSRIIFMSSDGGSMSAPVGGWSPVYCLSKTLMNGITRQVAHAMAADGIVVNAMSPGWVKTDMGGSGAVRSVEKGAETAVWLATDPEATLSGYFWRDKQRIPW
ncbi:MAG: SDR family NAD(P)-dependent oxidoreductase [Lewinellaceae bacterium]|nr:SDR family NAD(P)-dependent oxidoreductase [Lewinellaceae bacterium]